MISFHLTSPRGECPETSVFLWEWMRHPRAGDVSEEQRCVSWMCNHSGKQGHTGWEKYMGREREGFLTMGWYFLILYFRALNSPRMGVRASIPTPRSGEVSLVVISYLWHSVFSVSLQACLHPAWPSHLYLGHPSPSSGISFQQSSIALQPQRKRWDEGSRVGSREAGAGVREEKDQGRDNFSSGSFSCHAPHNHYITASHYMPNFFCNTDLLLACYPPHTPAIPQILPIYAYTLCNTPILSSLHYFPLWAEKGSHIHCSSLQCAVSSFSPLHPL